MQLKRVLENCFLGSAGLIPVRWARHGLFLLQSDKRVADRWGYHIRPIHYYEPLPDFRTITEAQTSRAREFVGIDFNWEEQRKFIASLGDDYGAELAKLVTDSDAGRFDFANGYFGGLDAAVYYALIRRLKPSRIIEIGSGYSTQIASKALAQNRAEGKCGTLTCIEPYPEARLLNAKLDIELIKRPVEEVPIDLFATLAANDILFIDSSHTVKFNSDVCYEFLEILPRVNAGVWVHVHDIFLPYDYPAEWLIDKRIAFNEQYLLEAFLIHNSKFRVWLANHWLSLQQPRIASKLWPRIEKETDALSAASFWMKREAAL